MGLPIELYAVRHGESTANRAFAIAARTGAVETDLTERDADIPLTPYGRRQAEALGRWLGTVAPDVVVCSSYRRARQTTEIALGTAGLALPVEVDARLRDRELGRLELLTAAAVRARFPDEVVRRRAAGELDYRPPGGESFWDVADRVREALADIGRHHDGRGVLVVAHDAVVLMLRAVIERLSDAAIRALAPVGNASVTHWSRRDGALRLRTYNSTGHLPRSDDG